MKLVDFLRESTYEDSAHEEPGATHEAHEAHGMAAAAETTESLFDRQLGDRFVDELRSMFARMNEVGARHGLESRILSLAGNGPYLRLRYAWSAAFALRGEYAAAVSSLNQARGKFNVDSSYLLIQAQRSLADYAADGLAGTIRHDLPRRHSAVPIRNTSRSGRRKTPAVMAGRGWSLLPSGGWVRSSWSFRCRKAAAGMRVMRYAAV